MGLLGGAEAPFEEVAVFYNFWFAFKSWRDFADADECGGSARGHATTSADSDGGEGEDGILAELARTRTPNLNIVVVSWVSARGRLLV